VTSCSSRMLWAAIAGRALTSSASKMRFMARSLRGSD
jgi:hypothetical protein